MSPRAPHLVAVAVLALVACASVSARAQVAETSVTLVWTAPGDDGTTGQAARYDLRWSTSPIASLADFAAATPVSSVGAPRVAGTSESAVVSGLVPSTGYWFALRTADEAGNLSPLSNVINATTLASTDTQRPAPVALALTAAGNSSVTLSWTDVGDDSLTGVAIAVEIRWSTASINEPNWSAATAVFGVPAPGTPGTAHQLTVTGLDRTRDLWFAARARDDVNRVSGLTSTLMVPHLLDTAPPATPGGLAAGVEPGPIVRVHWAANAEPDLAGYHVYRAPAAGALYTRLTTVALVANQYVDAAAPDSAVLWYAVSAVDATGNESARSAPARVFLTGGDLTAWDAATPYPNPSRVGAPVTIPLEVPGAGPYDATVEILNAAGEHVRTLRVTNATPGPYALLWDGRNTAGRDTAPGVYRAWLRAGDRPRHVVLVRVP